MFRNFIVLICFALLSNIAFANAPKMDALGQSSKQGSFFMDDYRNMFRFPQNVASPKVAAEFEKDGNYQYAFVNHYQQLVLHHIGAVFNDSKRADLFATDGDIGFRLGIEEDQVDASAGFKVQRFNLYNRISKDSWLIGGSFDHKILTAFAQFDGLNNDDYLFGIGRLFDINEKLRLNLDITHYSLDDTRATLGLDLSVSDKANVYLSEQAVLDELIEADAKVGFRYSCYGMNLEMSSEIKKDPKILAALSFAL